MQLSTDIDAEINYEPATLADARETIAQLRAKVVKLESDVITDGLTQTFNRRWLDSQLDSYSRSGDAYGFLMVDIDHFKPFNDAHGHAAGDRLLAALPDIWRKVLRRKGDAIARYGGEEFSIILPTLSPQYLGEVCGDLIEITKLTGPLTPDGRPITISIGGVCKRSGDGRGVQQIVDEADQLLYKAKFNRNCYVIE